MLYEVIIDSGEKPNKCTIAPLSSHPEFRLYRVQGTRVFGPLSSSIFLHHEGECLTSLRKSTDSLGSASGDEKPTEFGIASVDCVWPRLDYLISRIASPVPVRARIPDGFRTAYPRISKSNSDPEGGLATIEAIFIASALLGNWNPSILSHYYFGRKFVEMNLERFLELGVHQASDEAALPVLERRPRHSLQRRLDRGKRVYSLDKL